MKTEWISWKNFKYSYFDKISAILHTIYVAALFAKITWNIDGFENGGSLFGAETSGKGEVVPFMKAKKKKKLNVFTSPSISLLKAQQWVGCSGKQKPLSQRKIKCDRCLIEPQLCCMSEHWWMGGPFDAEDVYTEHAYFTTCRKQCSSQKNLFFLFVFHNWQLTK